MPSMPEMTAKPSVARNSGPEHPFPRSYMIVLVCAIVIGMVLTGVVIEREYRASISHTQALLTRASNETANTVQAWLHSATRLAKVIAGFPAVNQAVLSTDPRDAVHANDIVDRFRAPFGYDAIYAVDTAGVTKVHTADALPLAGWLRDEAVKNSSSRVLTCYESGASPGFPELAVLVPIAESSRGASQPPIGTLIILINRSMVAAHAEPNGEDVPIHSLLFGRNPQGEIVRFSHQQHPAPGSSWRDTAAEAAMRGEIKFMMRQAGDGTMQYILTRPLPEFGWGMVTRQARSEVLAPVRHTALVAMLSFLVGAALLVTFAIALWRHQQVYGLLEEVQRRAVIEEELRQSEERFTKAFTSCPEGMSLSRASDGRFIDVNESFATIGGYTREEVIGHTSAELGLWADPKGRERLMQALQRGEVVRNWRIQGRLKGGGPVEVEVSAETVQIQGEPCLLLILRDITHQLLLEEQLRQAQKMEAMGRLAGGIAHDFNNMLAVVSLSCEMLSDDFAADSQQARKLQIMRNACDRAAGLTRQLLAFSRQQVIQPKVIELNAVVVETKKLLERVIGEHIQIQLEPCDKPAHVCMDVGQLVQVLMNLTVNARDAMTDGGTLTIRTEHRDHLPSPLRSTGRDENYALLSVSDTGAGIPPNVKDHIFEPFFTTKKEGEGTGLGLATVYGVVQQSHGHISVESEPGRGATFLVYLPEVPPPDAAAEVKPDTAQGARAGQILLVEDDQAIRRLTRELLEGAGYRVTEAADGADALELFTGSADSIDLVITDVVMPRTNGRALAAAIRALSPRTKVLFMSAYSETRQTPSEEDIAITGFIQKPFGRPELLSKVRELLTPNGTRG